MARKGHARRTLSIPNPVNQLCLVEELSNYWTEITSLIGSSALSVTKCDIMLEGRAVPLPPLSGLADKRVILYAALGAILQTDILSFYHSSYTHAIPWALHGKTAAKINRSSKDARFFGNKIDMLVRSCQDGQTMGLPIGPDTSRIISEILLCAVEAKIPASVRGMIVRGFRYIDDFFLCFDSLADAEATLAGIRDACLHFDLQLNASKTRTMSALAFNEETWPNEVAAIRIAQYGKVQRRSLMRFFSTVIRLSKNLPDESIATYAVRMTTKAMIDEENWDLYEAFLLRMARENSNCIDSVVKILCTYSAIGYSISPSVKDFIERIIVDHAPYNQHFEVAWALWLAHSLRIRLSEKATSLVVRIENDVCAILALHLRSQRLLLGRGRVSDWLGSVSSDDLHGPHWLLVYEAAARKGWRIGGAAQAVAANPFFAAMASEGVSFYNTRAHNRPLKLPGIQYRLQRALAGQRSAILPGAIEVTAGDFLGASADYEELGGDYDEEEADDDFFGGSAPDDDDDESPI